MEKKMSLCIRHGGSAGLNFDCPTCAQEEHNEKMQRQSRELIDLQKKNNELIELHQQGERNLRQFEEDDRYQKEREEIERNNEIIFNKNQRRFPDIFRREIDNFGPQVFARNFMKIEIVCGKLYTRENFIGSFLKKEISERLNELDKKLIQDQQLILDEVRIEIPKLISQLDENIYKLNIQSTSDLSKEFGIFSGIGGLFGVAHIYTADWEFIWKMLFGIPVFIIWMIAGALIDSLVAKSKKNKFIKEVENVNSNYKTIKEELENDILNLYKKEEATAHQCIDATNAGYDSFEEALHESIKGWSQENIVFNSEMLQDDLRRIENAKHKLNTIKMPTFS